MARTRRTFALPKDLVDAFEREVQPGRRSAQVTELLREWVARVQRERLRTRVIEGCKDMAEQHLELSEAFRPAEEELQRDLDTGAW